MEKFPIFFNQKIHHQFNSLIVTLVPSLVTPKLLFNSPPYFDFCQSGECHAPEESERARPGRVLIFSVHFSPCMYKVLTKKHYWVTNLTTSIYYKCLL